MEPANGSVKGSDSKGRYVDDEGKIHVLTRQSTSYTNTGLEVSTDYYLVNADGNIEFPIMARFTWPDSPRTRWPKSS